MNFFFSVYSFLIGYKLGDLVLFAKGRIISYALPSAARKYQVIYRGIFAYKLIRLFPAVLVAAVAEKRDIVKLCDRRRAAVSSAEYAQLSRFTGKKIRERTADRQGEY